jgi:hypothetical protein
LRKSERGHLRHFETEMKAEVLQVENNDYYFVDDYDGSLKQEGERERENE